MRIATGLVVFLTLWTTWAIGEQPTKISVDSHLVRGKEMIGEAVDTWSLEKMVTSRAHFERLLTVGEKEWLIRYYLGYTDWRLSHYYMSQEDEKKTNEMVEDGINQLETCIKEQHKCSDAHALLSSLYGTKISLHPEQGMTLGQKSGAAMEKAVSLDPKNPRAWYLRGVSAMYTPPLFGGGLERANEYLHKAVQLFETVKPLSDSTLPTWGHGEAYGWLALVQLDQDSLAAAEASLAKALKVNPANAWLTYEVAPKLEAARRARAQAADSAKAVKPSEKKTTVEPKEESPEEAVGEKAGAASEKDSLK
jgi:tetratricopeptide (TPR) repeat protein